MKLLGLNKERWYMIRMTNEGARKYTSILNQMFPEGGMAIVTTIENYSMDLEEIHNRDVIFHVYTSPKKMEGVKLLAGNFIKDYRELTVED